MKKLFLTFAAVICCVMISTVFTACGSDAETQFVAYHAETVGNNLYGDMVCTEMDKAISKAFGDQIAYARDDNKAIKVCDEVAAKVRDNSLVGTINLVVRISSTDPNANLREVVKTYKFPF